MAIFDIELRTRASLHPDGEPDEFISAISGTVTCTDETGEVSRVGKLAALRVHAGLAYDAGESLFDVCDCHSHELHVLHALLYEPDGSSFKEGLVRRFDAVDTDLLVLDYVVLAPQWRRLRLGLLAVRKLVDLVGGGCGLAVSLIAPLRHDAAKLLRVPARWIHRHTTKQARHDGLVRLRRYFRTMGFRRLGRSAYYALPLNQVTPGASELLRGAPPSP
jgi:hypothetical protein